MKNLIWYFLFFYVIICAFTILLFDGTGDSGDSITHYLFARYAPAHPALYFDHWAKPLFVLLASPFAQFGFMGIKVFNAFISLLVIFFTYKASLSLGIKNAFLAPVLLVFSPLFYILTFSGLTEPLFALLTILGIFFCSRQKYIAAAVIISFLPYVRSEGLIIIGVFVLYFLYRRSWKIIPCLFAGSVFYGVAGSFVHRDLLWVFTKIPYAKLSSVYGHGRLLHFVEELINVTGVPIYCLFWLGIFSLVVFLFKKCFSAELHILIFLGFLCFFIAHSLFWYLGIFNSMGLKRVLIGIMPLIVLIALQGFNFITENRNWLKDPYKKAFQAALLVYILIFPFTPNPSAIQWEKDMMLNSDQKLAIQTVKFIRETKKINRPLLYNHRYLSIPLEVDYFDPKACKQISRESIAEMKPGDLLIWDNFYTRIESGLSKSALDSMPQLKPSGIYKTNERGREIIFAVFEKK